jgi:hypothetical protein
MVSADTELNIRLPGLSQLLTVHGHVINPPATGVGGMQVQVTDLSGNIISTTALTDTLADPGGYKVLVDTSLTTDTKLQVVAQPGPQTTPQNVGLATLLSRVIDLTAQPPMTTSIEVDFSLPSFRVPQGVTFQVTGTGTSGATLPIQAAQVQAQAYLSDPALDVLQQQALYSVTGTTDSRGLVTLPLVPAHYGGEMLSYTMLITSPATSTFASSLLPLQLGPAPSGTLPLVLPLRTQVSGRILSASGAPVSGAQVLARGLGSNMRVSPQLDDLEPQALTDANGRFALRLDQDYYDLDIVPVVGTQPRFSVNNQLVLTDDVELGYIYLPRPTLGKMLVLEPNGYPAPSTSLRVFQLTPPLSVSSCAAGLPCKGEALLRAEFTTDNQGRAEFLLPDASP